MVGRSITLTATARHKDGSVDSGAVFEWESRDPAVASVEGGVVTGVDVGTARIHASVGPVSSPDVEVSVTAPPLGSLTVRATPRTGGQTLTVSEPVGSGLQRRYRVDDAAQDVEWGQVCDLKSGWSAFPLEGAITGSEGQHATVVDVTVSGAYARIAGSAVLPAPAVNL